MSADEPGDHTEVVAASERAVVIREQQLREAEHDRSDERDLEGDHDVLRARSEEHEHAGHERRPPRPHSGAPHDRAEQRDGREVQQDDQELVRHVAANAYDRPQHPVRQDRQRGPVLIVRPEEITEVAAGARGEKVPVVGPEPPLVSPRENQGNRREQGDAEDDQRRPRVYKPSQPPGLRHRAYVRIGLSSPRPRSLSITVSVVREMRRQSSPSRTRMLAVRDDLCAAVQ